MQISSIRPVDLSKTNVEDFKNQFAGCIVVSQDNKILLQQRGHDWHTYPGYVSSFGGRIEQGESPIQALVRELNEELGAVVDESEVISLGAVTEEVTNHTELVFEYFWHDRNGTITGCYEGEMIAFDNNEAIFTHPKVMDDVLWMLLECQSRQLLP